MPYRMRCGSSWKASCTEAAVDGTLAGLDAKAARKRAQKLLNNGDRDGAKRALADANPDEQQEPPCPRLVVNDATVEKLGELLNENQNGLLLIRDELPGFLAKMESEECQGERAFYLEAFNGDGRFTYDRIGRGTVVIENCTLSLVGGVQPSRLAPIVRGQSAAPPTMDLSSVSSWPCGLMIAARGNGLIGHLIFSLRRLTSRRSATCTTWT